MPRNYMYDNKNKSQSRAQREQEQVNLRTQKREDLLQKKRTVLHISNPHISENRKKIFTSDLQSIYEGVYEIRRILSVENNPPIDNIINSNLLPRVAELLNKECPLYHQKENIQIISLIRLECAWIITNVASGNSRQTDSVVRLGVVKSLIDILDEDNIELIDQSVWALGNIGGDSECYRDLIIDYNGGIKIINLFCKFTGTEYKIEESFVALNQNFSRIKGSDKIKMLRNCIWLLSNLLRGREPQPNYRHMKICFEFFSFVVFCDDEEVVKDSLWALSYIVDCSVQIGNLILQSQILNLVFELMECLVKSFRIQENESQMKKTARFCIMPILRLIGNIITGTDEQTNILITYKQNMLMHLLYEIYYKYNEYYKLARVRKEVCWMLSNIAAGSKEQVDLLIKFNMHSLLIDSLQNTEIHVKNESCHAILNLLQHAKDDEKIYSIITADMILALHHYLELVSEARFQALVLNCYELILKTGDHFSQLTGKDNEVVQMFDERMVDLIEDLQESDDKEVHEISKELILKYFGGEEEE